MVAVGRRLLSILFWSVIAAAFIGPGTVTTAAASGTRFGFSLLWALAFSTVACLVLQEAAARVTVVSGSSLAQAIRKRFHGGAVGALVIVMVLGAIILGCAAYEAGNILGGVAGAGLKTSISPRVLTLAVGVAAALLLLFGTTATVVRSLGVLVALMGVAFLVTAFLLQPPVAAVLKGTLVPTLPEGSSLLVLGLIGTTVVPYNLFLGSGIAGGQALGELRFGLSVAILLGGIISMGILVVGTAVAASFSFETLLAALSGQLGEWAAAFFAIGLFAAGFSSAITAPLAAAITARGLFGSGDKWHEQSWRYRSVWGGVLATGVFFGLLAVRPIPVIIVAQALNGILLPFVAVFLLILVNDRALMGDRGIAGILSNSLMGVVVAVTIVLGVSKTAATATSALGLPAFEERTLLAASAVMSLVIAVPIARVVRQRRNLSSEEVP
jgi:Mn2+/Fe2+ NRAMP family transporter